MPAADAERLDRAEDAYLLQLAAEALVEVEAGAPTLPWEQFKAELRGRPGERCEDLPQTPAETR